MNLKNKKILITAGPTWVPIDKVRVISNIATGETGMLLAKRFAQLGAKATLFLGPVGAYSKEKNIRVLNFKFFDELRQGLRKELRQKNYDLIIHSAAVSDFKPAGSIKEKIISGKEHNLRLLPLPKIVKDIKRLNPKAKLLIFKLEAGTSDSGLIRRAQIAQDKTGADYVVANRINPYRAFILNGKTNIIPVRKKSELAKILPKLII